ncbi:MAG: hypothetical protein H0W34_09340 [Pyrinomonadaceae bacterium]|nr:hypothetical protein [Pyrinomonadaceae bacterium]
MHLEWPIQYYQIIKDSGIGTLGYERNFGQYRLRLIPSGLERHGLLLAELMKKARHKGSPKWIRGLTSGSAGLSS